MNNELKVYHIISVNPDKDNPEGLCLECWLTSPDNEDIHKSFVYTDLSVLTDMQEHFSRTVNPFVFNVGE